MSRVPRLRYFHNSLQELVRQLPFLALIPLALAIFAPFSVLGPVTDLLGGRAARALVARGTAVVAAGRSE